MLDATTLNGYLGKHISEICGLGYASDSDNHCAHFVGHVLGLRFGATCATMSRGSGTPASIRVQELFAHCTEVGAWGGLPERVTDGLVFITHAGNVHLASRKMDNVPRKHVGIFLGATRDIWHYSNSRHQVVTQTPEEFSHHYPAPHNAMFWGTPL